jgi:hypothetical protein
MSTFAQKVGREAQKGASGASSGRCLRYVGNAVQRAKGEKETPTGIESACDSAPFFTKRGYA